MDGKTHCSSYTHQPMMSSTEAGTFADGIMSVGGLAVVAAMIDLQKGCLPCMGFWESLSSVMVSRI